jgi:hypothetical protein
MKRSQKIQLVLITAALASCNRVVIPSQSATGFAADSTLTRTPEDTEEGPDRCVCTPGDSSSIYVFDRYADVYYSGQANGIIYVPGRFYRRGLVWRNHQFILRGGFGKSASVVGS